MDDFFVQMSLAVLDDVVLGDPTLSIVYKVLVCEALVSAAVPSHQRVGVLPGMCWRVARFVHIVLRSTGSPSGALGIASVANVPTNNILCVGSCSSG